MNIRIRNPAARMISGKVSQKDIFKVKTMSTHNRIYGTSELTSCHILPAMLGWLYLAIIDCQDWVDVFDVF
jgi:hypothetical protein